MLFNFLLIIPVIYAFYIPIDNITVFMSLGDSVTAGFGILGELEENRGLSFSIGGDSGAITLPNLFKKYTGNDITGVSLGNHFLEIVGWDYYKQDHYNVAQSEAVIQDIPKQIEYLKEISKNDSCDPYNLYNPYVWKHINLFIGANNLCRACKNNSDDSVDMYRKYLSNIIDTIYDSFDNTILTLLSIPDFTNLKDLEKNSIGCEILHLFIAECICIFKGSENDINIVYQRTKEYNRVIREIYFEKKSYYPTLLLHPFNEETIVPSEQYVSSFDCFHPSLISHENFAIASWNSLFLPFEKKMTKWNFNTNIYVPKNNQSIVLF